MGFLIHLRMKVGTCRKKVQTEAKEARDDRKSRLKLEKRKQIGVEPCPGPIMGDMRIRQHLQVPRSSWLMLEILILFLFLHLTILLILSLGPPQIKGHQNCREGGLPHSGPHPARTSIRDRSPKGTTNNRSPTQPEKKIAQTRRSTTSSLDF